MPLFNELFDSIHMRATAERKSDLEGEQRFRVQIVSILQQALELHLPPKWAEGSDGTIDGALAGTLEYDDRALSFSGTAVWYDSEWYEDPLSNRIELSPDGSGSVGAYAIRFGDADHGLRKFPYSNHSKHRYGPEPARWSYEFRKA